MLAKASENAEEILYTDCDLSAVEGMRQSWPFLRDRRVDAYSGLERRFLDE